MASPSPTGTGGKKAPNSPVMRSGLKPYRITERKARTPNDSLLTNPNEESISLQFIPKNRHDTAFTSLRHMVFKVDCKSASPIANILAQHVSGGGRSIESSEVFGLLNQLSPPNMDAKFREAWWSSDEIHKLEWPPYAKFRVKIEEARRIHATRLRDAGMEDVEIAYSENEAKIKTWKDDRDEIESTVSISVASSRKFVLTTFTGW